MPLPAFLFHAMMLRLVSIAVSALLSAAHVSADDAAALMRAALENLLAERGDAAAFDKAVTEARKHGVREQAILEARFLHCVDRGDEQAIAALVPECLKWRDTFRAEDSAVFATREDWLAVVEYTQAIAASRKGDKDAFKRHITEAFWLSPGQGAAFAPHIERLRMDEAMRDVTVDFQQAITPLNGGDAVALAALMKDRKALLIHFWSPHGDVCAASMDDFAACAETLVSKGISVLSLIPADAPELIGDARGMARPMLAKPCGAWCIDAADKPMGRMLRVRSLPSMVLVSTDGKVLFNGDPGDERLWNALRGIDPGIVRPDAARDGGE
jgi:hypothetical protein